MWVGYTKTEDIAPAFQNALHLHMVAMSMTWFNKNSEKKKLCFLIYFYLLHFFIFKIFYYHYPHSAPETYKYYVQMWYSVLDLF